MTGRHIDVCHLVRCDQFKVGAITCNQVWSFNGATVLDLGIGRCHVRIGFFIGSQPDDFIREFPFVNFTIRCHEEAVIVDTGVDRQAGNQPDIGPFRSFDRTNSSVVGNMYIADFEAGTFSVEATGAQRGEAAFVG